MWGTTVTSLLQDWFIYASISWSRSMYADMHAGAFTHQDKRIDWSDTDQILLTICVLFIHKIPDLNQTGTNVR